MSLTRNVAHNTIIQFTGKIIGTIIGVISLALITRYLGPEGYGGYTTALAFLSIFGILADMGLYIIVVREISKKGADEESIVGNVLTLRLAASLIILSLAPLVGLLFPYPGVVKTSIAIGAFSFLFVSLNQVLIGVFQKHMRMDKVAIGEILGRSVLLGGTIYAIMQDFGLYGIVVAIVVGSAVNFSFVILSARKFVKIRLRFNFAVWKKVFFTAFPIAISVVLNLIYLKIGIIFLSVFQSQEDVGIFGQPFKVLEVLVAFPAIFAGLLMPALSHRYSTRQIDKFAIIFRKGFDFLSIIVFPLVVGTLYYAKEIVLLVSDEEFIRSADVLVILIFATGVIFFGNLFGNTVVAIDRQKKLVWGYLSSAVVAVVANFILVQRFSYIGAAISSVISETLIAIIAMYVIFRYTKIAPRLKTAGKALISSLIMLVVFIVLPSHNLFIGGAVGGISYVVFMFLFKGISMSVIKEVFQFRGQGRAVSPQSIDHDL